MAGRRARVPSRARRSHHACRRCPRPPPATHRRVLPADRFGRHTRPQQVWRRGGGGRRPRPALRAAAGDQRGRAAAARVALAAARRFDPQPQSLRARRASAARRRGRTRVFRPALERTRLQASTLFSPTQSSGGSARTPQGFCTPRWSTRDAGLSCRARRGAAGRRLLRLRPRRRGGRSAQVRHAASARRRRRRRRAGRRVRRGWRRAAPRPLRPFLPPSRCTPTAASAR
mmetsp:Transcript_5231/g.15073  ORF Transcript_5231/g.15073 Transcript_5231/m.15073 type:complete len:230 (-) Transcript_5231:156-845(-)